MWAAWTAFINVGFASADGNAEFLTMVAAVKSNNCSPAELSLKRTETGVTVSQLHVNRDDNDVSDIWCLCDRTMPVDERMWDAMNETHISKIKN